MERLIEIEEAIRVIDRYISDDDTNLKIKLAITNIPTVDAEPVRHGHLINPNPYGECSICGYLIDIRQEYNYCPNCGAKMDERREDAKTN